MTLNMRRNPRLKNLRWVMLAAMCCDATLTLIGQPREYWSTPATAMEANAFFAAVMRHGWGVYLLTAAACAAIVFFLTLILRERIALVILLAATLSSYFGASSWLVYHWGFGATGETITGIVLAIALVKAGIMPRNRAG
jgi:hypothetical protein